MQVFFLSGQVQNEGSFNLGVFGSFDAAASSTIIEQFVQEWERPDSRVNAPQWDHNEVNRTWYLEPATGLRLVVTQLEVQGIPVEDELEEGDDFYKVPALQEDRPEMYGDVGVHLSGTIAYDPEVHGEVLPCPFCGGHEIEIQNTHTPSYWLQCQGCEAEMHGEDVEGAGGYITTGDDFNRIHAESIKSAIKWWNTRDGVES